MTKCLIHLSTFYITARSDRGLPYSTPLFPPEDILFWTIATCQCHFWILLYSFQKLDVMTSLQIWFCFPCFFLLRFLSSSFIYYILNAHFLQVYQYQRRNVLLDKLLLFFLFFYLYYLIPQHFGQSSQL